MSKLIGLMFALALGAPSLAHAGGKLIPVTPKLRAAAVRSVNASIRAEGGKNQRGMTVLVNNQGRGIAFNKNQILDSEISGPYRFTVKNGKVGYAEHLYMERLNALKGNF